MTLNLTLSRHEQVFFFTILAKDFEGHGEVKPIISCLHDFSESFSLHFTDDDDADDNWFGG